VTNLFWRIFLSFWVAMMLIVIAAVQVAEHIRHLSLVVLGFALLVSVAACSGVAWYLSELLKGRQQLTRDFSHELRSPLTRMQIALGLARRSAADVGMQLDRIELEARRLDRLVGQILRLSKLDEANIDPAREPVDLRELIEEIVESARLEARTKQVEVGIERMMEASVRGDRDLLLSAIENVLRNAVHYTPVGTNVLVTLQRCVSQACVLVRDEGPGVPAPELSKIFAPFYRVTREGEADERGHGIGLAITLRVLKLHHGRVLARNREGGGLEVELRLPLD
jgi:two-component system, OmpR family, sensor kinase